MGTTSAHFRVVETLHLAEIPGGRSSRVCPKLSAGTLSQRRNNETRPSNPLDSRNDDDRIQTRLISSDTSHSKRFAKSSHARNATRARTGKTIHGPGRLVHTNQILHRPCWKASASSDEDAHGGRSGQERRQDW